MSNNKKKILAFTGIRSDYDLLSSLYFKLNQDPTIDFRLIVAGAHLSETYGRSIREIEKDQLPILAAIETLLDSNSHSSRIKSAAILIQDCLHSVVQFSPDVILYAGDREDTIVGGLIGSYLGIPTVHFFGGDHASDGHVDHPIRHATSKLSSIHFVAHTTHRDRLIKIGEAPNRIFLIGSPAIDKFKNEITMTRKELLTNLDRHHWEKYALVIFHPHPNEAELAGQQFEQILCTLKRLGLKAFVGAPNSDAGNRSILEVIRHYNQDPSFCFYKNLDRTLFVNLMRNAEVLIGNSSAGLYEAPAIGLPVVNVGLRQKGRLASENVIFVESEEDSIQTGITAALDPSFKKKIQLMESPYGDGNSSEKAYQLLKSIEFSQFKLKTEDPLF